MSFNIKIPSDVLSIIQRLNNEGYESYIVGGCVRDAILGKEPHDWDICTNAIPEDVMDIFKDENVIPTGLQHGTVTVCINSIPYEITTFRIDGEYSDNRRPDSVKFSANINEDLGRRDFTMNAIAYNPNIGLIDPFGGVNDIKNRIIRCVGNPDKRFNEDALRMLRAMRFASTYGFLIQQDTENSLHKNKELLNNIAYERVCSELVKMLMGEGVLQVLLAFDDVMATIIPEIKPCIGFNQNNKYHQYTIYDHIAHAVANDISKDISIKVALLLHDIGKPSCYSEDENGGHFYGHSIPSHDLAECVLDRLRFDNKTKSEVAELVLYHDSDIAPTHKTVRRWLNKIGETRLRQLIFVKMADASAHKEGTFEWRIKQYEVLQSIIDEVIAQDQCFKLRDLAVNGEDLISIGYIQGKELGDMLRRLLSLVIEGKAENDRDKLLDIAKTSR